MFSPGPTGSLVAVSIVRWDQLTISTVPATPMLTGYCYPGGAGGVGADTVTQITSSVPSGTQSNEEERLTINVRDVRNNVSTFHFDATVRASDGA